MKKSVIVSNVALQDAKLHATSDSLRAELPVAATGLGRRARRGPWAARESGARYIATDGECGTNVFLFVVVA